MSWERYPRPPPKLPPPEHGIKVRAIGSTWWGRRWVGALEHVSRGYAQRLGRGRSYARDGRVHDLEVGAGKVTAYVTGSRPAPYEVTLAIAALDARVWEKAIRAMAAQALFAAELLSGRMPQEIDQAFRSARASLFPEKKRDLRTRCSCPDEANPCKHVAAVHYVLGEAFDRDPFLLFELRGRGKDEVLAALRARRARSSGQGSKRDAPRARAAAPAVTSIPAFSLAGQDSADYERLRSPLPPLGASFEPPASPGALLRSLGTPPSWTLATTPAELLGPAIQAAATLARELALRPALEEAPSADLPERVAPERKRRSGRRAR